MSISLRVRTLYLNPPRPLVRKRLLEQNQNHLDSRRRGISWKKEKAPRRKKVWVSVNSATSTDFSKLSSAQRRRPTVSNNGWLACRLMLSGWSSTSGLMLLRHQWLAMRSHCFWMTPVYISPSSLALRRATGGRADARQVQSLLFLTPPLELLSSSLVLQAATCSPRAVVVN